MTQPAHSTAFIRTTHSVEPFDGQPLTYGSARDNGRHGDTSDDSEDSNDEANAANDYPDTEEGDDDEDGGADDGDGDSVGESDMRRAFRSMEMGELRLAAPVPQTVGRNRLRFCSPRARRRRTVQRRRERRRPGDRQRRPAHRALRLHDRRR